jgi:hypothetical protein
VLSIVGRKTPEIYSKFCQNCKNKKKKNDKHKKKKLQYVGVENALNLQGFSLRILTGKLPPQIWVFGGKFSGLGV